MSWLLIIGLKNAILALPIAVLALGVGRLAKRPALAHVLWALVLVKLVTPPLIDVPVGWRLNIESWVGAQATNAGPSISGEASVSEVSPAQVVKATAAPAGIEQPSRVVHRRTRHVQRSTTVPASDQRRSAAVAPVPVGERGWFWWAPSLETWLWIGGAAWVFGSTVTLAIMLYCGWRFRRFVHWAAQRDHALAIRVGELAAQTGVRVPPKVVVVDGIVSPMLWGLGQNVRIVFPARLAERLNPAALDSLLLHELAHYARGDHWVRVLELAACVIYWWNPLLWFALRQIEAAEEACCDAWVIQRQRGSRHSYAEALLTTIDFLCDPPMMLPPAACGLGEASILKDRLVQIMRGRPAASLSRAAQVLLVIAGLIVAPLEPALWATSTPKPTWPAATVRPTETRSQPWSDAAREESAQPEPARRRTTVAPVAASRPNVASAPRPAPAALWATAISPNGQFRIEARTGRKITLVDLATQFRLDLSTYGIDCVAFSPSSLTFATGHEDAEAPVVRLWDSASGGVLQLFQGAEAPITSVQFSPDGRRLAAGAADGTVLIWDVATGEETARLVVDATLVSCLRWSAGGDRLAIAFGAWNEKERALLVVWSPEDDTVLLETPLAEPAGALEWQDQDKTLVIAAWDGGTQVWNATAGEPAWELQLEKDRVSAAAWSPNCPLTMPRVSTDSSLPGTDL